MNGEGLVELVRGTLRVAVHNADKLLDLDNTDIRKNTLFQVIQKTVEAIAASGDPRQLISREVFQDIMRRVLPVVSANVAGLENDTVSLAVTTVLRFAKEFLYAA